MPLACACFAVRFGDPDAKAKKRPFLGRLDASRTETPRSVFPPRKREKTDIPTAGDKTSPAGALWLAHLRAWKRTHETRIHDIQWILRILRILRIFSGKQAIMRFLGFACARIFCGFYRSAWIYPWTRPYRRTSRRAECTRKTHASPTSWGYWGYRGYFRGRGFLVALSAGASMRRPQIATLGRIRWDERPETRGNVRLAHLRARYPCVCAVCGMCGKLET